MRIVIVGGGAGGLELACKLGRKLGADQVALVDNKLFHIWKPSLHEVAAGTLDVHQEGLSYEMLAHDNGFEFVFGPMLALDEARRCITIGEFIGEDGELILPQRELAFDHLVIAVGSTANHFGVPGAAEHSISLNGPADAERFRLRMLKLLTVAELQKQQGDSRGVDIVIIGGGATGVELAAELREAGAVHARYGFRHLDRHHDVRITLIEGSARILEPLPEKVSAAAARLLGERHVRLRTNCRVVNIQPGAIETADGSTLRADIVVWAAGIKPPPFVKELGLPVNRGGQLVVNERLAVEGHEGIYALGDCAACPGPGGRLVPPRAQAAHQQADYLYEQLLRIAAGRPPLVAGYHYHDHGSLVSLGTSTSVGNLMGNLFKASWFVEGVFARTMYVSLHLMHHRAVLGLRRTGVLAVARFLVKRARPLVKLH
ncbi:MAG: FAD-dependent oxidoreductase [Roseateles depolymerans]|uniref:FAD-dependent oxidoreductase n=1 Tax=Roseateles depolymerans TaxID=76731 RepID=A0A2W5E3K2_9BURK|nr:MAG: FAD-dependent oxidoreductase [Roseateles depolymerans]